MKIHQFMRLLDPAPAAAPALGGGGQPVAPTAPTAPTPATPTPATPAAAQPPTLDKQALFEAAMLDPFEHDLGLAEQFSAACQFWRRVARAG